MRRVVEVMLALGLLVSLLPFGSISATDTTDCIICIVEVQTAGANSATEEYVVVANVRDDIFQASSSNPITLKYFTAGGTNTKSRDIIIPSSLAAHSVVAFVSDSLHIVNPTLSGFPSGLAFSDSGGTLQLLQNGQLLDQIGWGTASLREGIATATHNPGQSLVRRQTGSGWQDTGNNSDDIVVTSHACFGLAFNEIQPFAVDTSGDDIDPSIELLSASPDSSNQDCPIQINGVIWDISAGDINVGLSVITEVSNSSADSQTLLLNDSANNNLQFMSNSLFGDIILPGSSLNQPVILPGQSYVKISSTWKATYLPTPGLANQYSATPPPLLTVMTSHADSCDRVVINELLPNPVGEDSGQEWIELRGLDNETVFLANCAVLVNDTKYSFAPDQWVSDGQFSTFANFSDGQTTRTLSLKNTGVSTVSFGRVNGNNDFEALQTIQYSDSPEGQSWARFNEGWRWLSAPTPGEDNATLVESASADPEPTEFPIPTSTAENSQAGSTLATANPLVIITELLPNPASPQTDEADEFVELYNPGIDALDLDGYKVQTGSNYSYSFTIDSQTIPAGGYLVLTSSNTGLTLANSAGQARLLSPNGTTVSQTDPYQDAPEGRAWTLSDGVWQWSSSPTPGSANVITIGSPTKSNKKSSTKKSTKAAKTTKPKSKKAKKTSKSKATAGTASGDNSSPPVQPLHMAVLVAVGAAALLYGAYEYRQDVANFFYKFRRNREIRRVARA